MIVRFDKTATAAQGVSSSESEVESDPGGAVAKVSEAEKIVLDTKQKIAEGTTPAVGVSASNSGRGYDTIPTEGGEFIVTTLSEPVAEENETAIVEDDGPEISSKDKETPKPAGKADKPDEESKK